MAFQSRQDVKGSISQPQYYTGLKLDLPDDRDFEKVYGAPQIPSADKHPVVDLRKYVRQVYSQGQMYSCTANIICAAYELELNKQAEDAGLLFINFDPSRLFVYYNARKYQSETGLDKGASIRDTLKAMFDIGACQESLWPYDIQNVLQQPPIECYRTAMGNKITKYESLNHDLDQFRACLKDGFPIAFGLRVYNSFLTNSNDVLMPVPSDEEIQNTPNPGLHGVLAVGYNDKSGYITILNSWSESFGHNGYFYMPYKVISDPELTFNFWKIGEVSHSFPRRAKVNKL